VRVGHTDGKTGFVRRFRNAEVDKFYLFSSLQQFLSPADFAEARFFIRDSKNKYKNQLKSKF